MIRRLAIPFVLVFAVLGGWWSRRKEPTPDIHASAPPAVADASSRVTLSRESSKPSLPGLEVPGVPGVAPKDPEVAKGMSRDDWLEMLDRLAGEDYLKRHPGKLEKLVDLLMEHPRDETWEAGVMACLAEDLKGQDGLSFWERVAEALPANLVISDRLIREALVLAGDRLDSVLAAQQARTPMDKRLAWLRASVAFKGGREEDAAGMLKEAVAMPDWAELSGVAELAGLDVQEALEGPLPPMARLDAMVSLGMPDLARLKVCAQAGIGFSETLRGRGFSDKSQALLGALDRMGADMVSGSRNLVTMLVGGALQEKVAQAQLSQARGSGDLKAREDAEVRLGALKARRAKVRQYMNRAEQADYVSRIDAVLKRFGVDVYDMESQGNLGDLGARLAPQLTRDDLEILARAEQDMRRELDDFRAWEKAGSAP